MTYEEYLWEEDFLMHHGIKGQRWGIRRTPEQLGHYIKTKQMKRDIYVRKAEEARAKGNSKRLSKIMSKIQKTDAQIQKAQDKLPKAEYKQKRWEEKRAEKEYKDNEKWLKKASVEDILKTNRNLTNEQLDRAAARLQKAQAIAQSKHNLEIQQANLRQDSLDSALAFVGNMAKAYGKYEDMKNLIGKIIGSTERKEKKKKDIITSMDLNTILNNKGKLSTQDLQTALNLYNTTRGENRSKQIKAMNDHKTAAEALKTALQNRQNEQSRERDANRSRVDLNRTVVAKRTQAYESAKRDVRDAKDIVSNYENDLKTAKRELKEAKRNTEYLERITGMSRNRQGSQANAAYRAQAAKEAQLQSIESNLATWRTELSKYQQAEKTAEKKLERSKKLTESVTGRYNQSLSSISNTREEIERVDDLIDKLRNEVFGYYA